MGKAAQAHQAQYKPMPFVKRFWVYNEGCYSEEELVLREWIIKTRSNSGILPDLLANPSSWFNEDSLALIDVNEKAWFLSNSYKPRHSLSRDDFHVQPIDEQRLQWPLLYDLMQETGDYLLLRNQVLPTEHLNQPMNFVLLDINNLLRGLSQNPNIKQVMEQLDLITHYLRTIEKNISPLVGSDRLFLVNFRNTVDKEIQPYLNHQIESKLLKDKLHEMSKTIKKLSMDRNRILHFALNINPVNPHPYDFSIEAIEDTKAYPTQAAKQCSLSPRGVVNQLDSPLELSMEQLKDCPNFKLITSKEEDLTHYAKAITDLNELSRFQTVISQIMNLLGQAGEFYTIEQFKTQMLDLLNEMDQFIDDSSLPVEAILDANTQAYHHAIQEEQNLARWKGWLSNERLNLRNYIKNQDTLAQFPSSTSDLTKTNKAIKEQISEVRTHLSRQKSKQIDYKTIAEQSQELNKIMRSMHELVKVQYEKKGLKAPKSPRRLSQSEKQLINVKNSFSPFYQKELTFLSPPRPITLPQCQEHDQACQNALNQPATNNAYLGFVFMMPLVLIALYLLLKWQQGEELSPSGMKEDYDELKTKVDDLLVIIQGYFSGDDFDDLVNEFTQINHKAEKGYYDVDALKELKEDLLYRMKKCGWENSELKIPTVLNLHKFV